MTYTLYKITHRDTGRAYIGMTRMDPEQRFSAHKTGGYQIGDIQRAMTEFGPDAFDFVSLETAETEERASIRERELIVEHGTRAPDGFNGMSGGEMLGGATHSEPTIARMKAAKAAKGKREIAARMTVHLDAVRLEAIQAIANDRGRSVHSLILEGIDAVTRKPPIQAWK